MLILGHAAFHALPCFAMFACIACVVGAVRDRDAWVRSGERAVHAVLALGTLAVVSIAYAMLSDRFDLAIVATTSSREQPQLLKLAFWAHHSGAQLLWVWMLSLATALAVQAGRGRNRALAPWSVAFLTGTVCFYGVLACVFADPFEMLPEPASNGSGLSAALQYPMVLLHPPILYFGLASFAVPFAYAVAALVTGELDGGWLEEARLWSVVAWLGLGCGILLGSYWAYEKLGWGGYWDWDPVQNASLLPWLASTAFLHVAAVQEKRRSLSAWTLILVGLTYVLCVLTRSLPQAGLVESIHAYSSVEAPVPMLLGIRLLTVTAGFVGLLVWRAPRLRSHSRIDASLPTRDTGALLSSCVLTASSGLLLLGTLWPVLSETLADTRIQVGPTFFARVATPIGVFSLVCLAWTSWAGRRRRRRIAGHLAHISLFVLAIGFSGATFDWSEQRVLAIGETWRLGRYTIEYRRAQSLGSASYAGVRARIALRIDDRPVAMLMPEKRFYLQQSQPWTRPAIYSTWREDLHVILHGVEADGAIALTVVAKPLVQWVWIGGWLLILGGGLTLWPVPAESARARWHAAASSATGMLEPDGSSDSRSRSLPGTLLPTASMWPWASRPADSRPPTRSRH